MVGRGSMMSVPDGAIVVRGDISLDRLGLPARTFEQLVEETDVIVHSAARTEWGLSEDAYRAINVEGAERVVAMAVEARSAVVLLSTAFVPAVDPDNPAGVRHENLVRPYLESKRAAEQIFRDSGQPLSILRLTNLVGDAETGSTTRKQIVHHVSEWLMRGRLPFFPTHPMNLIDILPVSTVAQAVAGCIRTGRFEHDYWLTAGAEALTFEEALAVCIDTGRARGLRPREIRPIDPGRIPPEELDRATGTSSMLQMLADVSEVIAASGGVLPSSMELLQEHFGIKLPDLKVAYQRSLEFWSSRGALR
jgi:thioester reductase-like protein